MKGFSYLTNVASLELNREACIGCGMCVAVCPHGVFALQGNKAEMQDFDACMECGACAVNCPVGAIEVDSGVGCASGMINEWLASIGARKTRGGGCC
ncbi:4Fe-4S ferredoxin iron-sulfur binding domain protein [Geobacter metallireducens RCH3]|uniref:Ferredoxin n=1 Tax=Geobacter metallireducens (strain ATCC 53774 / DSM 7210 / GS-15) TaxID=269799 RepID=Q39W97_GEOMG|nr:mercury methylation ferredoxin HgcB [Geobacter metallireducens]ABB31477.1 ferredoxin [Geobacter metallireducens GS-15]EHP88435.1 4Fe-4S ferredoxin iron-sulfur binding domain protein [Geobacter metallireducens RCH3]MBT1075576.1 ferredoxin family protein [Geobacter grbiciae]